MEFSVLKGTFLFWEQINYLVKNPLVDDLGFLFLSFGLWLVHVFG